MPAIRKPSRVTTSAMLTCTLRSMVAAVAVLADRRRAHTFEVRAGHIVKQEVVLDGEQLPEPFDQVLLQRLLVRTTRSKARYSLSS